MINSTLFIKEDFTNKVPIDYVWNQSMPDKEDREVCSWQSELQGESYIQKGRRISKEKYHGFQSPKVT